MQAREDTAAPYEAAGRGSVETLYELIQNDQFILHKASLASFSETPLHISALMGHLEFTKAILELHPQMALELDSFRCSPLHLASAKGHSEIVKALLLVNKDVCLGRDEGGRIPLHLAAMRGRIEVVKELVTARMESKHELLDGDTVLHLCVMYNKLEILKLLVEMVHDDELLIMGNEEGNTILHLAAMLKQVEAVKYLLSMPEIKARVNTSNKMGLTALDLLDQQPKDFKTLEIRELLIKGGVMRRASHEDIHQNPMINTSTTRATPLPDASGASAGPNKSSILKSWLRKLVRSWDSNQKHWFEESRGSLMVVATVIATISFAVSVAPPGGFWQADHKEIGNCTNGTIPCYAAGTAIFAVTNGDEFSLFTIANSISLHASLSVIFMVLGGFPLRNKIVVWLLTLGMATAVMAMLFTHLLALDMLNWPFEQFKLFEFEGKIFYYWFALVIVVAGLHIIRLIVLTRKGIHKLLQPLLKRKTNVPQELQQGYPAGREDNPSDA